LTGALFAAVFVLLLDIAWALPIEMFRERAFALSLSAIPAGWLAGFFASRLKMPGASSWLLGFGVCILPSSWLAATVAIAASFLLRWRTPKSMRGVSMPCKVIGPAVHLGPVLVYALLPYSFEPTPRKPEPELPLASTDQAIGSGPDVVLVVIDTLRADVMFEESVPTPNLDALRARGVWADYALAPANQTLPSHLSLLCGLDIEKVGMRGNPSPWPTSVQLREAWSMQTLAERFYEDGWRTAAVASNTLLSRVDESKGYQGYRDGFELWNGMERDNPWPDYMQWVFGNTWVGWLMPKAVGLHKHLAYILSRLGDNKGVQGLRFHKDEGIVTTDACVRYVEQLTQGDRPYFFLAQYLDPHTPYMPADSVRGTLSKEHLRPAGFGKGESSELKIRMAFREGLHDMVDSGESAMSGSTLQMATWLQHLYREEIMALDTQLGRLFAAIEQGGRPTVVLFTSDHGEAFGEHGNINHGSTLFGEEVNVPFVLAGAGVPSTGRLPHRVEVVDSGRTLLELAGISSQGVDGQNVLRDYKVRPALATMVKKVTIEDAGWKLIASLDYGKQPEPGNYELIASQLFHLSSDPLEKNNVLATEANQAEILRNQLVDRLKKDMRPFIEDRVLSRVEEQQLAALGYASGDDEH